MARAVQTWYPALVKPALTPPGWLFGPAWTLFYTLMGVALWLAWRRGGGTAGERRLAFGLFAIQLAVNAARLPVFFGAKALGAALVVIVVLVALIAATVWAFARVKPAALLAPYLAWVAFATYPNAMLGQFNGAAG